jgi:hypothetical protein
MMSLDLADHPNARAMVNVLAQIYQRFGELDKIARLRAGDLSELLPIITQIEAEHRAWVAEDLKKRHFGPPSPKRYEAPQLTSKA